MFGISRIVIILCGFCWGASLSLGQPAPALGLQPARTRLVIVESPGVMAAFEPQPQIVQSMVDRGILKLSGKSNGPAAWRTYVSTQDTVGIKVYSAPARI